MSQEKVIIYSYLMYNGQNSLHTLRLDKKSDVSEAFCERFLP